MGCRDSDDGARMARGAEPNIWGEKQEVGNVTIIGLHGSVRGLDGLDRNAGQSP